MTCVVANPADPAIMAAASQCTPGVTQRTVWVLNTSLQGQTINDSGVRGKVGPYVTQTVCCPRRPPSRRQFGAQLVLADFTVKGIFTNAAERGGYQWAGIFTPYLPDRRAEPGRHRRVAHLCRAAAVADLQAGEEQDRGVKFAGADGDPGLSPRGIRLDLYSSKKAQARAERDLRGNGQAASPGQRKLKANGKYSIARPKVKAKTFFQMRFENYGMPVHRAVAVRLAGPCAGEDIAAMTSNQVKVLPTPKKKHK